MRSLRFTIAAVSLWAAVLSLGSCASTPEAKGARYIEAGKKLMRSKDAPRAILQFENAVRVQPKNPEAYYELGMAFLAASDVGHGVAALRKAIEIDPKYKTAHLAMAKLKGVTEDKSILRDGEQELNGILQGSPDDPDALHALALTELKLGESENAIRDLVHAISAAPENVLIAETLAEVRLGQGDVAGAEEVLKNARKGAPNSVSAVVILGRFYLSQNRLADAERQLQQALAMDAKDSAALSSLASVQMRSGRQKEAEETLRVLSKLPNKATKSSLAIYYYQNGRKDEAIREFERLSKEDPEDRLVRTRLVIAYQAMGRQADAEKVLAAALKKNRKDSDALLQRGEMLVAAGKLNEAETDLDQVLDLQPDAPVHYVLGKLYQARGEALRYRQELSKALDLNPFAVAIRLELVQSLTQAATAQSALDVLDGAPPSQRDSVPFLVARNWVLWAQGDMGELRKGIDKGLAREKSTQFLLQDGIWKLRAGNVSGARNSLEEVLKSDPSEVRALAALQESYEIQKQTAVAVAKVKEYAARAPKSAPVQNYLGNLLLGHGDNAGARAAFQAAKVADAHSTEADLSLIQVDIVDGKLDGAQHKLQAILAASPANTTARLWMGNLASTKGDYKTALEQFRAVVAAEPNNPQALNNMAYVLVEQGKPPEALKYAQRAKELAPENAAYADTLGWILYQQGLYPSAIRELNSALAHGANPLWQYHLAMAYAKAGDGARAHTVLETALKQNPKLPEATMAQQIVSAAQRTKETGR